MSDDDYHHCDQMKHRDYEQDTIEKSEMYWWFHFDAISFTLDFCPFCGERLL